MILIDLQVESWISNSNELNKTAFAINYLQIEINFEWFDLTDLKVAGWNEKYVHCLCTISMKKS